MAEKVKVEVTKLPAFIELDTYIKHFGKPNIVFHINNFNYPLSYNKHLSKTEVLVYKALGQAYNIYPVNELYVKDTVVRFKEIEDYSYYQTELNFDESV
jgi:hypothetical protein